MHTTACNQGGMCAKQLSPASAAPSPLQYFVTCRVGMCSEDLEKFVTAEKAAAHEVSFALYTS